MILCVGNDKIDVVEEGGMRMTKKTGVYSGIELEVHMQQPFYDERLAANESDPSLSFNQNRTPIQTDEEWKQVCNNLWKLLLVVALQAL